MAKNSFIPTTIPGLEIKVVHDYGDPILLRYLYFFITVITVKLD